MARLTIQGFSCIEYGEIELKKFTIIIGPQASGKSVISKLCYYFHSIIADISELLQAPSTLEEFIKAAEKQFTSIFPVSAWGSIPFKIDFKIGPVAVSISRPKPRRSGVNKIRIDLSPFLVDEFYRSRAELQEASRALNTTERDHAYKRFELMWRLENESRDRLSAEIGSEYTASQLFVPAGRSFFTNMGKAVLAFEQGGFLDPITIDFGKRFVAVREEATQSLFVDRDGGFGELDHLTNEMAQNLFGGVIVLEKNEPFVKADDGRRLPFRVLSSGQQELMPLWLTVNDFVERGSFSRIIYLEEPEAHLFPIAQGQVASFLASALHVGPNTRMAITTHSPYILTVLNNLLKAGSLAGSSDDADMLAAIDKVVPRAEWLRAEWTSAYAIIDRRIDSIMGDDGMIDAEYIDSVSGDIGRVFMQLLKLEAQR